MYNNVYIIKNDENIMKHSTGDYIRTAIGYITYPIANALCRFGGREPQPVLRERFSSDVARMMYGVLNYLNIPDPNKTAILRNIKEFKNRRDLEGKVQTPNPQ